MELGSGGGAFQLDLKRGMGAVDRGKFIPPSFLATSSDFCSAIPLFPFLSFLL